MTVLSALALGAAVGLVTGSLVTFAVVVAIARG